jgi:hypothetical protein
LKKSREGKFFINIHDHYNQGEGKFLGISMKQQVNYLKKEVLFHRNHEAQFNRLSYETAAFLLENMIIYVPSKSGMVMN